MNDPILVFVPWMKVNEKHMEHFIEWYALNRNKHNLKRLRIYQQALHKAQARALFVAREQGCSHILFTEDDQWGYPIDGLDVLLEEDKDVIGFQTYYKDFPWHSMCCRKKSDDASLISLTKKSNPDLLLPFERGNGAEVQKTDLLTWAFTLVKIDVFDRMEEAGYNPFLQWGPHPTDSFFCEYCDILGIDRWVHFGATIAHGDLDPKDRDYARRIYDDKHPNVSKVLMKDDYGNPYGELEYISERNELEKHFVKWGNNECSVYDA